MPTIKVKMFMFHFMVYVSQGDAYSREKRLLFKLVGGEGAYSREYERL